MDEVKALEILKGVIFISRVGDDVSAPWVSEDGTVGVDADLNREQLQALLFFIDKKYPPTQEQPKMDEQIIDNSNKRVPSGLYEHYKRGRFVVLGVAKNCKTEEEVVVFYNEFNLKALWVRPVEEFLGTVELNGEQVPRFVKLDTIRPASEVLRG